MKIGLGMNLDAFDLAHQVELTKRCNVPELSYKISSLVFVVGKQRKYASSFDF
jgi:hypothetical protein